MQTNTKLPIGYGDAHYCINVAHMAPAQLLEPHSINATCLSHDLECFTGMPTRNSRYFTSELHAIPRDFSTNVVWQILLMVVKRSRLHDCPRVYYSPKIMS